MNKTLAPSPPPPPPEACRKSSERARTVWPNGRSVSRKAEAKRSESWNSEPSILRFSLAVWSSGILFILFNRLFIQTETCHPSQSPLQSTARPISLVGFSLPSSPSNSQTTGTERICFHRLALYHLPEATITRLSIELV